MAWWREARAPALTVHQDEGAKAVKTQQELAASLAGDLFDVIAKYDGLLMTTTVVGALDFLKFDLIEEHRKQVLKEMLYEKQNQKPQ
jgi:hypothetical protein